MLLEKISWTDRVKYKEILRRVKVERTFQCTVKRRKGNWIGHSWRRNCLPQHVIEGTIERTRRRGRKRKQLLDDLIPLTPKNPYSGPTAPLTSKRCILYIYSTNTGTEYFKHGINSPFLSLQYAVGFIILIYLVPVLFIFYTQGVLKFKKKSGAKRLRKRLRYCILKEESSDRTLWATHFGRGCGPVVRQAAECLKLQVHAIQSSLNRTVSI